MVEWAGRGTNHPRPAFAPSVEKFPRFLAQRTTGEAAQHARQCRAQRRVVVEASAPGADGGGVSGMDDAGCPVTNTNSTPRAASASALANTSSPRRLISSRPRRPGDAARSSSAASTNCATPTSASASSTHRRSLRRARRHPRRQARRGGPVGDVTHHPVSCSVRAVQPFRYVNARRLRVRCWATGPRRIPARCGLPLQADLDAGVLDRRPGGDVDGDRLARFARQCRRPAFRPRAANWTACPGRRAHERRAAAPSRGSAGVPLGANGANHDVASKPGKPSSATVGRSGALGERLSRSHGKATDTAVAHERHGRAGVLDADRHDAAHRVVDWRRDRDVLHLDARQPASSSPAMLHGVSMPGMP